MLQLLQANTMTTLVDVFCARSRDIGADPLIPTTVLVQNYGMGQWLKFQTAERAGIAANIQCQLPADFIWQVYQWLLPQEGLQGAGFFNREQLTWQLLHWLEPQQARLREPVFAPLNHYLSGTGDPQLRCYQLSAQIADLFDQYLVYRPDWISQWEAERSQTSSQTSRQHSWQPALWRLLRASSTEAHRADLHQQLLQLLAGLDERPARLPERLAIFGLSALPPIHLATFQALGQWLDVDIYFLNPCAHYWGDIVSEKDLARRSIRAATGRTAGTRLTDDDYLEVGNPLLASMGKQGREFFELLLENDAVVSHEQFTARPGAKALAGLQNDILNLEFGGQFGSARDNGGSLAGSLTVQAGDSSIQIHSCHSKLREIEVLLDQLLLIFAERPDIHPSDVIVMTPDIAEYAPVIQAVFKDQLFYSLADRGLTEESAVLLAFEKLLALPESRLTSTDIMDLLEVPAIARRFALAEADLALIGQWIRGTNIRWEYSGRDKTERWDLPATQENTWTFGLERLLLGYAMESEQGLFAGRLPFDVNAGDGELLGTLCDFVHLLQDYRQRLALAQPATGWLQTINALLADLFRPAGDEELDIDLLRGALQQLADQTASASFTAPISGRLLRHWLGLQLAQPRPARGFLRGGITFATLVPMRSIPFKVVCLLGMNDHAYPRQDQVASFNLITLDAYRKGDRSRRVDDRYLFLEALLAAQDYLYISYAGRSLKTNKVKPSSVLVSELSHYLQTVYGQDFVTEHPLQPFSPRYFDPRLPALQSYQRDWFEALVAGQENPGAAAAPFVDTSLADDPDLLPHDLAQLARFLRHPARDYLQQRLGVYFAEDDGAFAESEPFSLDGLDRYQLADGALQTLVHGGSLDTWQAQMVASGQLMPGPAGVLALQQQRQRAEQVFAALPAVAGHSRQAQLALDLSTATSADLAGISPNNLLLLQASITDLQANTLLHFRAATLRRRQLLTAWLDHLFMNALDEGPYQSLLISLDNKHKLVTTRLAPLPAEAARQHLADLVGLYIRGMRRPLPFLPELSASWFEASRKGKSFAECQALISDAWQDARGFGEGQDPAYQRLWDFPADASTEFANVAQQVYGPLQACMEKAK